MENNDCSDEIKQTNNASKIESVLKKQLKEADIAFNYLLKKKENDKKQIQEDLMFNIKMLIEPYLEKLKITGLNKKQQKYIEVIKSDLHDLVSSFHRSLHVKYKNLTPTEIQISDLIRQGNTSKDIAELMNLSDKTVATHRNNIRYKLGLNKKKISLRNFLANLEVSNLN
ncbi:MAG: hypothetical protein HQK75_08740 [Candidatus Magnetomorum sp.]|nr:hypothetical protein [Candidatus Magnetomorum sp.]